MVPQVLQLVSKPCPELSLWVMFDVVDPPNLAQEGTVVGPYKAIWLVRNLAVVLLCNGHAGIHAV